jgi:hypothetical protein
MVHQNKKYSTFDEAKKNAGGLAVLGFFLKEVGSISSRFLSLTPETMNSNDPGILCRPAGMYRDVHGSARIRSAWNVKMFINAQRGCKEIYWRCTPPF